MLTEKQLSILFYVFISLFILLTCLTIWGVFFGLEHLEKNYKDTLFTALLMEIVGAVILLFKLGFGIKSGGRSDKKIWVDFDEETDVKQFIGKDVIVSPRTEKGNPIGDEFTIKILNDRGLYVVPKLPDNTESVFVTLELDDDVYEGSFSVQSFIVKLEGQEL